MEPLADIDPDFETDDVAVKLPVAVKLLDAVNEAEVVAVIEEESEAVAVTVTEAEAVAVTEMEAVPVGET